MEKFEVIYRTVEAEGLASAMKSGSLDVLATPQMIAWMEEASCLMAGPKEGCTTVGVLMDVTHDAASLPGSRIRIVSRLVEKKGRISTYAVSAWMDQTCIGKGVHKRAEVSIEKFMNRLYAAREASKQ